jgi:hypothetical protein
MCGVHLLMWSLPPPPPLRRCAMLLLLLRALLLLLLLLLLCLLLLLLLLRLQQLLDLGRLLAQPSPATMASRESGWCLVSSFSRKTYCAHDSHLPCCCTLGFLL